MITFATAGTYTLKVVPTDLVIGSMSLRIWNVPADLAVTTDDQRLRHGAHDHARPERDRRR